MFKPEKSTVTIQGQEIEVIEMSARQRKNLSKVQDEGIDLDAYCIQQSVPAFSDLTLDEVLDLPSSVFNKLSDEILRLSGLSEDASEEARKNS